MAVKKEHLGQIFVKAGIIDEEQLQEGLRYQQDKDIKIGKALIELGYINDVQLAAALSNQLDVPYVRLSDYELDYDLVSTIPEEIAQSRKILPIEEHSDELVLAVADPLDIASLDEIEMMVGKDVETVIASHKEIGEVLEDVYDTEHEISQIIGEVSEDDVDIVSDNTSEVGAETDEMINDTPVVKMVNTILLEAVKNQASDIHLEPFEHKFMVRIRLDGVLHELEPPPKELQSAIISRIKVMADMDIAERRRPQDGRITVQMSGREVDYRVSTLPTVFGESVVLRQLSQEDMSLDPSILGMTEKQENKFKKIIQRPNGIVLNTGPTSSGKTTTLFAGLSYVNDPENKILTMEDPVEYQLPGVIQTQVNDKVGFTFAKGMRSMLRQDPDICLVGEIRDIETAEIAVQASLTGHLVLSTVHTNQAAGALTRLTNMGVKPFLLTSTIQLVLAQRLVRVICDNCREEYRPDHEHFKQIGKDPEEWSEHTFTRGAGCEECGGTGYDGRTAIFELLEMTDEIKELCNRKASATEIHNTAVENGMKTMTEHGWEKALDGITTLEEVVRVAPSETEITIDKSELDLDPEMEKLLV